MPIPGKNKDISIAILGPGAVGGFLTALLIKYGYNVVCIDEETSGKEIEEKGIRLESKVFGDFTVKPKVISELDTDADIIFITTKATYLKNAVKRIKPERTKNAVIVPLLNGIEHNEYLRSIFGDRIIAATIGNVELKRISANHIQHTTKTVRIELAKKTGADEVKNILTEVGIDAAVLGSEAEVVWRKLVRLNALACTTAASKKMLGFIRSDSAWREKLEGSIKEGASIAAKDGVTIDPIAEMKKIDSMPETLGTSMQRDVLAGRPSEIDAIAGAVVRTGEKYGLNSPVIKSMIEMIESRENG